MIRAQPFVLFTWFWSAIMVLIQSFIDRLKSPLKDPLNVEERIEWIGKKANVNAKTVRELRELFIEPATSYPSIILRELWLDRAFLLLIVLVILFQIFLFINNIYSSFPIYWLFIPLVFFFPFFIFYTKSIISDVSETKEPKEKTLAMTGLIADVKRVVYGHTHVAAHEMIGPVEYLNSGTWSPAFKDVECEHLVQEKTYIWIQPGKEGVREAQLFRFFKGKSEIF